MLKKLNIHIFEYQKKTEGCLHAVVKILKMKCNENILKAVSLGMSTV